MRQLIFAALLFCSAAVGAAPVKWVLDGVTFADGYSAEGSFTYDMATSEYSEISITTYGVDGWGTHYDQIHPQQPAVTDTLPVNDGGTFFFGLSFVDSLTDDGGTVDLLTLQGHPFQTVEGPCGINGCTGPDADFANNRYVTSGSVRAVPVPAAAWLFGSALAGLGWIRRKQTV